MGATQPDSAPRSAGAHGSLQGRALFANMPQSQASLASEVSAAKNRSERVFYLLFSILEKQTSLSKAYLYLDAY